MIGIYVWALLIIIICICVNGWEFIGFIFLCLAIFAGIYGLFIWIDNKSYLRNKRERRPDERSPIEKEKERAIEEWEHKWHKPHPSKTKRSK